MEKKLIRSTDKRLKGVCAGIAEYLNMDITIVRALYAVLTFATSWFPGVILYIILALVMPDSETKALLNN